MDKQLVAGYILSFLQNRINNNTNELLASIAKNLCYFDVEINTSKVLTEYSNSLIDIYSNIISRGSPTYPNLIIEDYFGKLTGAFRRNENLNLGEITYEEKHIDNQFENLCRRALYIIDPRIKKNNLSSLLLPNRDEEIIGDNERLFIATVLNHSHPVLGQVIEWQREIKSILNEYEEEDEWQKLKPRDLLEVFDQKVDFAIQCPYSKTKSNGYIIEIDGEEHTRDKAQVALDEKRDNLIEKNGWKKPLRITTNRIIEEPESVVEELNSYLDSQYICELIKNYEEPIYKEKNGIEILETVLSPYAIARLQKTFLTAIKNGLVDFEKTELEVAIIERDVQCGDLAIKDLQNTFRVLKDMAGEDIKLPEIKWEIYISDEFKTKYKKNCKAIKSFNSNKDYDIIFDISVLQRKFENDDEVESKCAVYIKIRSAHSRKTERKIECNKPINYDITGKNFKTNLEFILQNIFRKLSFRDGQIPILEKALTNKNVIALLPTGAGKSLTYQFASLLQPGMTLIVDPIKSLMRDQDSNLKKMGIDKTVFINSSVKTPALRKKLIENMGKGYYQFIFVSPERLLIKEFRSKIESLSSTHFAYCVVDEAHCVSEWGHDFRTAYLKLGENVKKYCKTANGNLPIIGLTGTASFDVLADVQRELQIEEESSIIAPSEYKRDELNFYVEKCEEIDGLYRGYKFKEMVAQNKREKLYQTLDDISQKLGVESLEDLLSENEKEKNAGIIFAPHVTSLFGVVDIHNNLLHNYNFLEGKSDVYAGSLGDEDNLDLDTIQDYFKTDKLKLLVATKAFGMGIDKPNIRFTVHFNMPPSIESFYQEAGRAGRDRRKAICCILYSGASENNSNDITIDKELMYSFHRNSFPGEKKEKTILFELLTEINYPDKIKLNSITDIVNEEFGEVFRLKVWYGKYQTRYGGVHKRLYINKEYPKGYGYIDLRNDERIPENREKQKIVKEEEAKVVLEAIYELLQKYKPSNMSLIDWLREREPIATSEGIEKIVEKLNKNEIKALTVGFRNKIFQDIVDAKSENDLAWDEELIASAYAFTNNAEEFLTSIKRLYKKRTGRNPEISQELNDFIGQNYFKLRDVNDTFKAVYRLSIIGIIDDYEADYNSKTILIKVSPKSDQYYIEKLTNYISHYVSKQQIEKVPNEILECRGESTIQKCCGYLIKFVYDIIESKRHAAIDSMENAIIDGLNGEDFEEVINTYFDSKYTPELRPYLRDYQLEVVFDFINKVNGIPDNVNHLRGACDRLLVENPQNPLLLLLRSHAKLLIPNYDKSSAIEDLENGLNEFVKNFDWTESKRIQIFNRFYNDTIKYDESTATYLDSYMLTKHLKWLKKFNKNFTRGIEYAKSS